MDFIIETIEKNEPKAKNIKTISQPNGDLEIVFKVGRKTHKVAINNLENETRRAKVNGLYTKELLKVQNRLKEATKDLLDEYSHLGLKFIIECSKQIIEADQVTIDYAIEEIEKYFTSLNK